MSGSSVAADRRKNLVQLERIKETMASVTAMAAIIESDSTAGMVIFTDSNFAIAMKKAEVMADIIESCSGCTLLETLDVPISSAPARIPDVIRNLLARYGKRWTHGLAINDIYFDYAVPEFILAGTEVEHIRLLSAGDGSRAAFQRIAAGIYQTGTVAEPLNLHGWQLMDELNRLFQGEPVSGFVEPVHLTTPANIDYDGGPQLRYDPSNGYREIYRKIWKK
jgi:ribose transport system substrate-binding protein